MLFNWVVLVVIVGLLIVAALIVPGIILKDPVMVRRGMDYVANGVGGILAIIGVCGFYYTMSKLA
jgi:hypothetical protein